MIIGDRLRQLREEKKLSQGHIEKRKGSCAVISRASKIRYSRFMFEASLCATGSHAEPVNNPGLCTRRSSARQIASQCS